MTSGVSLEGVWFRYGGEASPWVLSDVSVSFEPGVTAIVGPNGSGKSTLTRVALGILHAKRGHARIDGQDVRRMDAQERAARVAYIAQRPMVSGGFRVREVVEMGRFALAPRPEAVQSAMACAGVEPWAERPWRELSAGQQQLVSVARAVAQLGGPESGRGTILADEPTASMDPVHVGRTIGLLRALGARGVAVVIVAHDVGLARAAASRAVLMGADGRIVAQGDARETLAAEPVGALFGVRFLEARTEAGVMLAPETHVARGV